MAITVNIYYTGKNNNARLFAQEMISSGIVKKIREEKGNLKYEYFFSLENPETQTDTMLTANVIHEILVSQQNAVTAVCEKYFGK